MTQRKLIRITGVNTSSSQETRVTFYVGDIEREVVWKAAPPQLGDVVETDPDQPDRDPELIGRAQAGAWLSESDALRWRRPLPHQNISRMEILRKRHLIRQAVRGYLDNEEFIEIDAPLLVHGTTPDVAVESFSLDDRYLVTSTEYQMKRLAVGGMEKIYSLSQNFRPGDGGTYRNPEFTMLEWGRVGEQMSAIEKDAEGLTLAAMRALGLADTLSYQGQRITMRAPWKRMSVVDAIAKTTGYVMQDFEASSCAEAVRAAGMEMRSEWEAHGDFLFSILMDHIQPQLGREHPVFITEWPLSQTTSAQEDGKSKRAVRSELFIAGIELSDGFAGLADPCLQMQFFSYMEAKRAADKQQAVKLDQRYMDAMRLGAPYGAGMALGFDRLVMLLTDQPHIHNVLAFNWDEV
jgi:elongation factor P--(R)-beta-lysine ligase